MAQRRMFAIKIIDSAKFLKMPVSSRLLYYDLGMRADDDGVVEAFNVIRMTGATEDDLKVLASKGYIRVLNEDLVALITDWTEHNKIRADRKIDSLYKDLILQVVPDIELLEPKERADRKVLNNGTSHGQPMDSIGKDRLGKDRIDNSISKDILVSKNLIPIVEEWNNLNLSKVKSVKGNRLKILNARIKEYGINSIIEAIKSINKSSFLKGQNNKNWIITFDWLIKPNNFPKVLEGNYIDKEGVNSATNITKDNETSQKPKYDFTCFE
ncbi:MAG: hypothetical protein PUG61_09600 [Sarcina ventriculi]|nr:hypothetical protein [Sarcina ventriculi]